VLCVGLCASNTSREDLPASQGGAGEREVLGIAVLCAVQVEQDQRESVLAEFVPNCRTIFRRSLPECQAQAQTYGKIWGEITVEVSSPLLIVSEPGDRKKKRKDKKKKRKQQLV